MIIRKYEKRDWDKILEIYRRAKPEELKESVPFNKILPLDKDISLLKSFNESQIFVGENEATIVGYSGYDKNLVSFLVVDPKYYRKKVGTKLLERVLSEIEEKAWLLVAKNNIAARELYTKYNFKIAEEFIGKYNGIDVEVIRLAIKPELESWKKK